MLAGGTQRNLAFVAAEVIILKYIFAVRLGWLLPSVGREDVIAERASTPRTSTSSTRSSPCNTESVHGHDEAPDSARRSRSDRFRSPIIMRITRASTLDVQNEDYVRTAREGAFAPDGRPAPRAP